PLESSTFFIRGTVVKPRNARFASLALRSQDGGNTQSIGISEDGSFEIRRLLPGSYTAYLTVIDPEAINDAHQNRAPQVQIIRMGRPLEITDANLDNVRLAPESAGRVLGR